MFNRGEAYERVAPPQCSECEDTLFNRRGRVGVWDGEHGAGFIYEAVCLTCGALYRCNSAPFVARDDPSSMRWYLSSKVPLGKAADVLDITHLSLRARLAIALWMFAESCERYDLSHLEIDRYLDYLWEFIGQYDGSGSPSGRWITEEPPLIHAGLGYSYRDNFEEVLHTAEVPIRHFRQILVFTTKVLYTSLHAVADESKSRHYLGRLKSEVSSLGVPLPDTRPYKASPWSDNNGWGNIPSAEELAIWRVH